MGRKTRFIALTLAGCTLLGGLTTRVAQAQDAVVVENGRLFAEFKTATLFDAVQMVQQAVGRTDYEFADEELAKATPVTSNTFTNAAWDNIIRKVASDSGFKVVPQASGKKSIELRAPAFGYGGEGGYGGSGGYPGQSGYGGSGSYGSSSSSYQGQGGYPGYAGQPDYRGQGGMQSGGFGGAAGLPSTPFSGGRRAPGTTMQGRPQTAPSLSGNNSASSTAGKEYFVLRVQRVYAGGIANLFRGEVSTITTEDFLPPNSNFGGGGQGGGFGGQGGGFGGQGGGFGGGGFGGGGFGGGGLGGGGGFGGGGFGGGGFGGGGGLGGLSGSGFGF